MAVTTAAELSPPTAASDATEAPKAFRGRSASRALRWSALAVFGKQGLQLAFGIALARILGPHRYGVVGEATLYSTLSLLLLDQGLSAALVQRKELSPDAPGAAATMNLASGVVFGLLTWVAAPAIADFFHTHALINVLRCLGAGLVIKAAAVAPRAMLARHLRFAALAKADLIGSAVGAVAGVTGALLGASYYALVIQVIGTDLVTAAVLLASAGGPAPNRAFGELRTLFPFGIRIFATNGLAYFSRNIDNALVGRYLGTASLSFYSMAYRVLVIPVQLLAQTVNRVLFPVFARIADDRRELARTLVTSAEMLSLAAIPLMGLAACASRELVLAGLGSAWLPAAPLISVLALAGARETVFYITPALMTAMGRASLNLRFEVVSTSVQVAGIIIGLQFGLLGTAVGYALAGLLMTPLPMYIQRRLTGVTLRDQLLAVWPAIHASAWAAAAYLLLRLAYLPSGIQLVTGSVAYVTVVYVVLRTFHAEAATRGFRRMRTVRSGRSGRSATQVAEPVVAAAPRAKERV